MGELYASILALPEVLRVTLEGMLLVGSPFLVGWFLRGIIVPPPRYYGEDE